MIKHVKLGEICKILNGFAFKSEKYMASGIRVVRITNVQKGYIEDADPQFYPLEEQKNIEKYMLYEGDLLISLTGNVGRVAVLQKELLPAALNQRVACIRISDVGRVYKQYLFHYLNSDYFEQQCIISAKGVAQKNMSTEWLKEYEIPLPTIEKQREIAEIFSRIDELISERNQQTTILEQIVKSRFIEMFGDPNSNPMHWNKVELAECLINIENGKSFVCDSEPRIGEKPAVLKLSAATYGYYQPYENKAMLDDTLFVESAEVHKGDLLFTRKNTPELVGMCAYVYDTPSKLMMPDLIFRLNTRANCDKVFLWKIINLDLFRSNITALSSGSAKSMSNISKERLLGLEIILPPIALQQQFAAFVEQTDKSKYIEKISVRVLTIFWQKVYIWK